MGSRLHTWAHRLVLKEHSSGRTGDQRAVTLGAPARRASAVVCGVALLEQRGLREPEDSTEIPTAASAG